MVLVQYGGGHLDQGLGRTSWVRIQYVGVF